MNSNKSISQVEVNKAVIARYFEAYNNKNETIFDEIISPDYIDHGQSAYMGAPGLGVAGAKNDLKNSLDKLDELSYVIEELIASPNYPEPCGCLLERNIDTKSNVCLRSANWEEN